MTVISFIIFLQVPETLHIFFQFVFSQLFSVWWFYWFVLTFTDSILHHLHSQSHPVRHLFNLVYFISTSTSIWFFNLLFFPSDSLFFHFFDENSKLFVEAECGALIYIASLQKGGVEGLFPDGSKRNDQEIERSRVPTSSTCHHFIPPHWC